jgi:hypothetical protein
LSLGKPSSPKQTPLEDCPVKSHGFKATFEPKSHFRCIHGNWQKRVTLKLLGQEPVGLMPLP